MLARALAATPWGVDARPLEVEVDVRNGLPGMQIVGLPDAAVRESRDRVRAAIRNSGVELPPRAVTVSLAPADLRKEGNQLDLAIALALLAAHGHVPAEALESRLLCGELGLGGEIRRVRGGIAVASLADELGIPEVVVPEANAPEAAALEGPSVIPVRTLSGAIGHLTGQEPIPPRAPDPPPSTPGKEDDLADVHGQETAKRALEIAAAGGHNVLLIGPPGNGKTMLARRLPGILPPMTRAEAVSVTRIHSSAGLATAGLLDRRPFRSPHTSISLGGMCGGGSVPRPGEVTLAHHGVLFLDELPEFRRDVLEGLRQPLEEGALTVSRARARLEFPARFTLVASMNPCPCGHFGDPGHECTCTAVEVQRYRRRISGPLLDRIDLHVDVPPLVRGELRGGNGEPSRFVAERVRQARFRQLERHEGMQPGSTNATLPATYLNGPCRLSPDARALLERAFDTLGLSARAVTRILRVARTIADLAGVQEVPVAAIAEAVQYRSLDRRMDA